LGLSLNGYNPFLSNVPYGASNNTQQQPQADTKGGANAAALPGGLQPQEMAKIQQIQAQYAGSCACAQCNPQSGEKAADVMNRVKAQSYADILKHEQAHQSAAGSLGGGIHIDYDSNGVAVAGHVPISIPGLDRANPELTLSNAQRVRSAALAPADPSGADQSIASRAQSLIGQAQVQIQNNKQRKNMGSAPPPNTSVPEQA
jgi:hypothetical protein